MYDDAKIVRHEYKDLVILELSGNISEGNSVALREALFREIKENRTPRVFLNFKNVQGFAGCMCIGHLVEAFKASRNLGLRMVLFGLPLTVRKELEQARLDKSFEIYDSEEQALSSPTVSHDNHGGSPT